jgi:hypothetical protein
MTTWTIQEPAVSAGGDVGGDYQAGEAWSVRLTSPDVHGALITVYVFAEALRVNRGHGEVASGEYGVMVMTEYLTCTDMDDPGGTETWSDYKYDNTADPLAYPIGADADTAARALAGLYARHPERFSWWDGKPWQLPTEGGSAASQPSDQSDDLPAGEPGTDRNGNEIEHAGLTRLAELIQDESGTDYGTAEHLAGNVFMVLTMMRRESLGQAGSQPGDPVTDRDSPASWAILHEREGTEPDEPSGQTGTNRNRRHDHGIYREPEAGRQDRPVRADPAGRAGPAGQRTG